MLHMETTVPVRTTAVHICGSGAGEDVEQPDFSHPAPGGGVGTAA